MASGRSACGTHQGAAGGRQGLFLAQRPCKPSREAAGQWLRPDAGLVRRGEDGRERKGRAGGESGQPGPDRSKVKCLSGIQSRFV